MIIPLGPLLPAGSSNLPESSDGPPSNALLFGLAPGGVCLASDVTTGTGELLPHRFTLTPPSAGRFVFCGTFLLVTETGRYPAPCPAEPGLSSDPTASGPAIICPAPNSPLKFRHHRPPSQAVRCSKKNLSRRSVNGAHNKAEVSLQGLNAFTCRKVEARARFGCRLQLCNTD